MKSYSLQEAAEEKRARAVTFSYLIQITFLLQMQISFFCKLKLRFWCKRKFHILNRKHLEITERNWFQHNAVPDVFKWNPSLYQFSAYHQKSGGCWKKQNSWVKSYFKKTLHLSNWPNVQYKAWECPWAIKSTATVPPSRP